MVIAKLPFGGFNVSEQLEERERRLTGALCFCLLCPIYAQHRTIRIQNLMSIAIMENSEYNEVCCLAHHRAALAVYILLLSWSFLIYDRVFFTRKETNTLRQ